MGLELCLALAKFFMPGFPIRTHANKRTRRLADFLLVLMLVADGADLLPYLDSMFYPTGRLFLSDTPAWSIYIFVFLGVLNLVFVCFLFLSEEMAFLWALRKRGSRVSRKLVCRGRRLRFRRTGRDLDFVCGASSEMDPFRQLLSGHPQNAFHKSGRIGSLCQR